LLQFSHNASGLSLYELVTSAGSDSRHEVVAFELKKTAANALGFMLAVDASERPVVKHVEPAVAVKKGDRQVSFCYLLFPIFGPGRHVPNRYSGCSCCCCFYQFSKNT